MQIASAEEASDQVVGGSNPLRPVANESELRSENLRRAKQVGIFFTVLVD